MKVIRKPTKEYHLYRECPECGAILEFMRSELDMFHAIVCPECGHRMYAYSWEDNIYENDSVKEEVIKYYENQKVEEKIDKFFKVNG